MPAYRLLFYQTAAGHRPFADWLAELADANARARIEVRLNRLALGSFGDCEPVGGGVLELRVSWGPGYRAYFARVGQEVVLLLCGGDKTSQQRDQSCQELLRGLQGAQRERPLRAFRMRIG